MVAVGSGKGQGLPTGRHPAALCPQALYNKRKKISGGKHAPQTRETACKSGEEHKTELVQRQSTGDGQQHGHQQDPSSPKASARSSRTGLLGTHQEPPQSRVRTPPISQHSEALETVWMPAGEGWIGRLHNTRRPAGSPNGHDRQLAR